MKKLPNGAEGFLNDCGGADVSARMTSAAQTEVKKTSAWTDKSAATGSVGETLKMRYATVIPDD